MLRLAFGAFFLDTIFRLAPRLRAAAVLRWPRFLLTTLRRAALPKAFSIAGVARCSLERPTSSALAVDSNTTSAAAFVAAPNASPAIVLTPCAASTMASFAFFVTVLTISSSAARAFDNANAAPKVPTTGKSTPPPTGRARIQFACSWTGAANQAVIFNNAALICVSVRMTWALAV